MGVFPCWVVHCAQACTPWCQCQPSHGDCPRFCWKTTPCAELARAGGLCSVQSKGWTLGKLLFLAAAQLLSSPATLEESGWFSSGGILPQNRVGSPRSPPTAIGQRCAWDTPPGTKCGQTFVWSWETEPVSRQELDKCCKQGGRMGLR